MWCKNNKAIFNVLEPTFTFFFSSLFVVPLIPENRSTINYQLPFFLAVMYVVLTKIGHFEKSLKKKCCKRLNLMKNTTWNFQCMHEGYHFLLLQMTSIKNAIFTTKKRQKLIVRETSSSVESIDPYSSIHMVILCLIN